MADTCVLVCTLAVAAHQSLLATARLAGDALAANTDESRYASLVDNFQGSVTALAEAIARASAEASRRSEEKAAAARAAEEARKKTQIARIRKELSEAASMSPLGSLGVSPAGCRAWNDGMFSHLNKVSSLFIPMFQSRRVVRGGGGGTGLMVSSSSELQSMIAENRDAGAPNDNATFMIEKTRANLAAAETLKNLLPADIVMTVFVTKTDDDEIVLNALQDNVIESLVVQFLGYAPDVLSMATVCSLSYL